MTFGKNDVETPPSMPTLAQAVTPELEAAGDRYTELVSKTHHVSTAAAGVTLESNDGTTALEYRRVVHP